MLQIVQQRLEEHHREHPSEIETLTVRAPRNGPGIGQAVSIRIQAKDYDTAKRVAEEAKTALRSLAGVYNVEDNLPLGPRELRIRLDEQRASMHDLSFQEVGSALLAANEGLIPSTFKDPTSNEDIDIRVLLREEQRRSIEDLLDVDLRAPNGTILKLADVAEIDMSRSYS